MTIKELKKGQFFTLTPIEEPKGSQVYVKGDYDRSQRKYECVRFDDICYCIYLKADKRVYRDFTF